MNPRDLSVFEHKTEAVAFYPNLAFNTVSNTAYMQLSGNKWQSHNLMHQRQVFEILFLLNKKLFGNPHPSALSFSLSPQGKHIQKILQDWKKKKSQNLSFHCVRGQSWVFTQYVCSIISSFSYRTNKAWGETIPFLGSKIWFLFGHLFSVKKQNLLEMMQQTAFRKEMKYHCKIMSMKMKNSFTSQKKSEYFCWCMWPFYKVTIQVHAEGILSLAVIFCKSFPVMSSNAVSEVTDVIQFTHKRSQK